MIEIFRSRDAATIGHLQGLLESEGIKTYYRNEYLSITGVAMDFTPALCIINEADVERGIEMVRSYLDSSRDGSFPERTCPNCGENSPGTFASCWNCGAELEA